MPANLPKANRCAWRPPSRPSPRHRPHADASALVESAVQSGERGGDHARATAPLDGLKISSQSWRRGGLGSKALVTFTLRNSNDYPVKDIEIFCAFTRRDGSHLTDRTRTIHDTVNMKSRKNLCPHACRLCQCQRQQGKMLAGRSQPKSSPPARQGAVTTAVNFVMQGCTSLEPIAPSPVNPNDPRVTRGWSDR